MNYDPAFFNQLCFGLLLTAMLATGACLAIHVSVRRHCRHLARQRARRQFPTLD